MLFKLVSVILLSHIVSAHHDCDGSSINADSIPAPQKNKAGFGEFPWTVALYRKDSASPHCAGSIIDDSTILTTAFCVKKISDPSDLIVRAGVWDLNQTSIEGHQMQQRSAKKIHAHPRYTSPDVIDNDIAYIRLNQALKFSNHVQPICLDTGSQKVAGKGCFATGWGAESYETQGELSQFLKKIPMDQVDRNVCEKELRVALKQNNFLLSENFLCAGGHENDLCIGDAGAPLVCPVEGVSNKFVLVGLSSYGVKCFTETPGVYTKVSRYHEWVHQDDVVPAESNKVA